MNDEEQSPLPWQTPEEVVFPPAPPPPPQAQALPPMDTATELRLFLAWTCIVICTGVLFFLQSAGMDAVQEEYAQDTRPGYVALYLGRYATGVSNFMPKAAEPIMREFDAAFSESPHPLESEIRSVILAAEIAPNTLDDRLDYLEALRHEVQSEAYEQSNTVLKIYADGYVPTGTERDDLIASHGWFGEMAASYNEPQSTSAYQSPRQSASIVALSVVGLVFTAITAGIVGFVLLVIGIVLLCMSKLRPRIAEGPAAHRTVYLETAALFLLLFIVLQLITAVIQAFVDVDLMLPFLLLSTLPIFWPIAMRVPWPRFKQDMGMHLGRGLLREIGAGLTGYIAGLPIIAVGVLITFMLSFFADSQPDHPLQYELMDGGLFTVFVTLAAAVIWAPVVEELIFRSAFYRHLRQHRGVLGYLIATSVTAFVFAAIHPQGWVGIPVLMSIAFVLSGLREWRGSILPSMVAHAIHNGAISLMFGIVLFA